MVASWDDYFITMAHAAARRATCPVKKVGAVFVSANTRSILSVGYNGAPRGTSHCGYDCYNRKLGERTGTCRAVHAEMNGIFNAALNGIKLNYSHCYLTISPCENCAKALIQVGVERVVYSEEYVKDAGLLWLNEARIEATQFLIKNPWWDKNEEIEIIA